MKKFAVLVIAVLGCGVSLAKAQELQPLDIADRRLIVCATYSSIETTYALALANQIEYSDDCWLVLPPIQVIVLQANDRFSRIIYREFTDDTEIEQMVARGAPEATIERARSNPWSPWYQRPAWAFSAWLEPSE